MRRRRVLRRGKVSRRSWDRWELRQLRMLAEDDGLRFPRASRWRGIVRAHNRAEGYPLIHADLWIAMRYRGWGGIPF